MGTQQKALSLKGKWNLIATISQGAKWDSGSEPFQSYELVTALRNELVHFKGELLGKDEAPNRKINGLMAQLGIESGATFIEDDASSWVADLLMHRELGRWVFERIEPFYRDVTALLLGLR